METLKKFNCKNSELIMLCEFIAIILGRDLTDFTTYAPRFNNTYLESFLTDTAAMRLVIFPKTKTGELKIATTRLYAAMDELHDATLRLEGYIKFAKEAIPLLPAQFGTAALKQNLRARNAESAIENLLLVNANIEKYSEALTKEGLSEEVSALFKGAVAQITDLNKEQFDITSIRRRLTAENLKALNALYATLMEICATGKMLYRKSHPERIPDYTFNSLLKKVRATAQKNTPAQ